MHYEAERMFCVLIFERRCGSVGTCRLVQGVNGPLFPLETANRLRIVLEESNWYRPVRYIVATSDMKPRQ